MYIPLNFLTLTALVQSDTQLMSSQTTEGQPSIPQTPARSEQGTVSQPVTPPNFGFQGYFIFICML